MTPKRRRRCQHPTRGTGEEEHLHLEFAGEVSLYVPASRIDMVQRYIGAGGGGLALDKIGGTAFRKRKRKEKVEVSKEMARDLESERPMDRLLCGDVGFGKTEMVESLFTGEAADLQKPRFEETEAGCDLEVGLKAYLPDDWIAKPGERLDALRALSQADDLEILNDAFKGLVDRHGRAPAQAKELLRLFSLKLPMDEAGIRHVAWRDDRYVISYTDAVEFEHPFAGGAMAAGRKRIDLRRIKPGVAHLVLPAHLHGKPDKAVTWLEKIASAG